MILIGRTLGIVHRVAIHTAPRFEGVQNAVAHCQCRCWCQFWSWYRLNRDAYRQACPRQPLPTLSVRHFFVKLVLAAPFNFFSPA
jgi:hypothetical protein